MSIKDKIIEIKDVYFRYDKNSDDIIKNFSLDIYKGEIFSLLGANGSGKSTMLKLIVTKGRFCALKQIRIDKTGKNNYN